MLSKHTKYKNIPSERAFDSICDVCLRDVKGLVCRDGAQVYLIRNCPEHGERRFLTSRNGLDFVRFDLFYHTINQSDHPPFPPANSYYFVTDACNQGCPFCLNEANSHSYFEDYEISQFAADVASWEGHTIGLAGGEPFSSPQIFDYAKIVSDNKKKLRICTNGLALADERKVVRLLEITNRVCEIRMTFEGFTEDCYSHLPVQRVLERKMQALENLKKYAIPTALCLTFDPVSTQQPAQDRQQRMKSIIDYALANEFVKAVAFQSAVAVGGARNLSSEDVRSVDGMMDDIWVAVPWRPHRKDLYVAQKLLMIVTAFWHLPLCENSQYTALFRVGTKWVGFDYFFDCDALDRRFETRFARRSASRTRLFLGLSIDLLATARLKRLPSFFQLALQFVPVFLHRFDLSRIPRSVLPIAATTACDRYNYDESLARRCDKWGSSMSRGTVTHELLSQMTIRQLRERERGSVV